MGDAITEMIYEYGLQQNYDQAKLVHNWENWMGKTIANRTSKIYFKDNKIFVKIDSAPLKQELIASRNRIISILNEKIGRKFIEEIIII